MYKRWSEAFQQHAQGSCQISVPAEFARIMEDSDVQVEEFLRDAQRDQFKQAHPSAISFLNAIHRNLALVKNVAYVKIFKLNIVNPAAQPTTLKALRCESVLDVCVALKSVSHLFADYSSTSGDLTSSAREAGLLGKKFNASVCVVIQEWLDISAGSEFRVFITGSKIRAIFQRKSESQSATAEQKKVQRGMLGGFLRTALQGPSAIAEYMVDVFIENSSDVWVLSQVPLEEASKPSPNYWSELNLPRSPSNPNSNSGSGANTPVSGTSNGGRSHTGSVEVGSTKYNSADNSESNSPMASPHEPHGLPPFSPVPATIASMTSPPPVPQLTLHAPKHIQSAPIGSIPTTGSTQNTLQYSSFSGANSAISVPSSSEQNTAIPTRVNPYASTSAAPMRTPTTTERKSNYSSPSSSVNSSAKTVINTVDHASSHAIPPPSSTTALPTQSPHHVELNTDTESHDLPPFLQEKYVLGPMLGKGSYAQVREGTERSTGNKVAIKILHRSGVKSSAETQIRREVHILSQLSHPNIVRTCAFFEEPDYFYTVLECINGGALFDRVKKRTIFTEAAVRELALVLLDAIKHCHERNIVHRDLKPENLIMTSDDNNADLKIVDFGFAAFDTGGCTLTDRCGSPMYVAPEILQKIPHGKPVDMWSFGVILFLLLSGEAPFKDPNVKSLYNKIKNGSYYFKSSSWKDLSVQAVDLVKRLLVVPQMDRLTVQEALAHPWFHLQPGAISEKHLSSTIEGLRSFQAAQRFRKGFNAVKALNRMKTSHQLSRTEYIDAINKYPKTIEARYEVGEVLGKGGYATVWGAVSRVDKRCVAIKVIPRANLKPATEAGIRREAEILRHLHHKNIVKSYDFVESDTHLNVVLERIDGGELFDRIIKKKFYNEKEARDLAVVMLKAIKHCHDHKIVHRDLKPENLLMTGQEDSADLKLVDFGFAAKVDGFSLTNQCGTPAYVAPEIIRKQPHGLPVDMWSFGVILYILLSGYPPFRDKVEKQLFLKIRSGVYEFHPKYWDKVSEDAKDLIRRLLVTDPLNRLTVEDALSHPWIHADARQLSSYDLSESLSELELFQNNRHFKAGINVIMAIHKMSKSRLFNESESEASTAANSASNSAANSPMPSRGTPVPLSPAASPTVATTAISTTKRMANLLHAAAVAALDTSSNSTDALPNNGLFTPESQKKGIQNPHSFGSGSPPVDSILLPTPPKVGKLHKTIQQQQKVMQNQYAALHSPAVVLQIPPFSPKSQPTAPTRAAAEGDDKQDARDKHAVVDHPISNHSPSNSPPTQNNQHLSQNGFGSGVHMGLGSSSGSGKVGEQDHAKQQQQLVELMHSLHLENHSIDCI